MRKYLLIRLEEVLSDNSWEETIDLERKSDPVVKRKISTILEIEKEISSRKMTCYFGSEKKIPNQTLIGWVNLLTRLKKELKTLGH